MEEIAQILPSLATTLIIITIGTCSLITLFISKELKLKRVAVISLIIILLNNLILFLVPSIFEFSYFGDSTRHLEWLKDIEQGKSSILDYKQYTAAYLFYLGLMKLGTDVEDLTTISPLIMYPLFICGFVLLARRNIYTLIPMSAFIFGLSQCATMPWHLGLMMIPLFITTQLKLKVNPNWKLGVVSLLLFSIIIYTHPHHLAFLPFIVLGIWINRKYFSLYTIIGISTAVYYLSGGEATKCLEQTTGIAEHGIRIYNPDLLSPFALIFTVVTLIGLTISIHYIRKKRYLPIVYSFIGTFLITLISQSGILLFTEMVRMAAYPIIITLILGGLLVRDLENNPRIRITYPIIIALYLLTSTRMIGSFLYIQLGLI